MLKESIVMTKGIRMICVDDIRRGFQGGINKARSFPDCYFGPVLDAYDVNDILTEHKHVFTIGYGIGFVYAVGLIMKDIQKSYGYDDRYKKVHSFLVMCNEIDNIRGYLGNIASYVYNIAYLGHADHFEYLCGVLNSVRNSIMEKVIAKNNGILCDSNPINCIMFDVGLYDRTTLRICVEKRDYYNVIVFRDKIHGREIHSFDITDDFFRIDFDNVIFKDGMVNLSLRNIPENFEITYKT